MMKNFSLKYGKSEVSFVLDGARSIQTLTENPMNTIEDIHAAFLKAISTDVIESPALDQLVSPEDQITIVISDMTTTVMPRILSISAQPLMEPES